jgi:hypothetical protein
MLHSGSLLRSLFDPEEGVDFERTIGRYIPEDRTLHNLPVSTSDPVRQTKVHAHIKEEMTYFYFEPYVSR